MISSHCTHQIEVCQDEIDSKDGQGEEWMLERGQV